MKLLDAFGEDLRIHDEVMYAGRDYQRKPTINKGVIEDINFVERKVLVLRTERSGLSVADTTERRVWVEAAKVGRT